MKMPDVLITEKKCWAQRVGENIFMLKEQKMQYWFVLIFGGYLTNL